MCNKTIAYYMTLPYTVYTEQDTDDGSWFAKVVELPGCMTCAETEAEIREMIEDAKEAWITVAIEIGKPVPLPKEGPPYS